MANKKTATKLPAPTPETPKKTTGKNGSVVLKIMWTVIILIIVVIVSFFLLKHFLYSTKPENNNNSSQTNNQPSTVVKTGKTKTLYRFADYPNRIIILHLNSDAEWYPKGGKIKYKTSTGKILTDEPGTAHYNEPEPSGQFRFWADDNSAWGVEIWQ